MRTQAITTIPHITDITRVKVNFIFEILNEKIPNLLRITQLFFSNYGFHGTQMLSTLCKKNKIKIEAIY